MAAVWAIEQFKFYLYGRRFTLITDHQALVSVLKSNRGNKTYQSRLTRWIDRPIPFDFDIHHLAGSKMGLIDYIFRHPVGKPQSPAYWDEQFVVASFDDFVKCVEFQDSSSNNISLNSHSINYPGTKELNRNENIACSNSVHTQTAIIVPSQLFEKSRSSLKQNSKHSKMSRQLQQGMTDNTTDNTTIPQRYADTNNFSPTNYASFNELISKSPP